MPAGGDPEPRMDPAPLGVIEVAVLHEADDLDAVQRLLATIAAETGVGPVDESEEERLRRLAAGDDRPSAWCSALLRIAEEPLGYVGLLLPEGTDAAVATGDVAVRRLASATAPVTVAALEAARQLARPSAARSLELWVRAVDPLVRSGLEAAGAVVTRQLHILGRPLPARDERGHEAFAATRATGVRIRPYRPDEDDAQVVAVLAAAYAGTDDGGWDGDRLAARRRYPWFRAEDLLVAEDVDGRLLGLHWLKQRGDREGEVYNLAVAPWAQGRRLGPALLQAGLDHLADLGCDRVVLWVDAANERAVRLYLGNGFEVRVTDVAVTLDVPG